MVLVIPPGQGLQSTEPHLGPRILGTKVCTCSRQAPTVPAAASPLVPASSRQKAHSALWDGSASTWERKALPLFGEACAQRFSGRWGYLLRLCLASMFQNLRSEVRGVGLRVSVLHGIRHFAHEDPFNSTACAPKTIK